MMQSSDTDTKVIKSSIIRPPSPSLFHLLMLPKKSEADMVLNIPLRLSDTYGEIIYHKFSRQYILTGAKGIEQVLKTNASCYTKQNFFHKRLIPLFGYSLLVSDGDYWKHRRKVASGAFQHAVIKSYTPTILTLTNQWIDNLADTKVNLVSEFNTLTLRIALKAFCSQEFSEKAIQALGDAVYFGNWYTTRALIVSPWMPSLNNFRFYYKMHRMNKILLEVIRERRAKYQDEKGKGGVLGNQEHCSKKEKEDYRSSEENTPDLLARLLSADIPSEGPLTDEGILAELKTLIVTGYETNALTLTWMFYLLAKNPDYYDLLEEEINRVLGSTPPNFETLQHLPVLKAIIFETMRLYPPVWGLTRRCISENEVLGYKIPVKSLVSMNLYALHRNPEYWEKPDSFRPERFLDDADIKNRHPFAYVPFSAGPRICIASNFALTEAMLAAASIVQRVRFVDPRDYRGRGKGNSKGKRYNHKLTKETEVIIEPCFSLRPKEGLFLQPIFK